MPQPQNILDFINQRQAPQPQALPWQNQQPEQEAPPQAAMPGLSQRIQEWLGAREPNQGGVAQDILSSRFQAEPNDVGRAAYSTFATGKPVAAQDFADERMQTAMKKLALVAQIQKAAQGGEQPSSIREYQYYNQLPPEEQRRFLEVKRQQQFLNLGDRYVTPGPGGVPTNQFIKGAPPEQQPDFKAAQKTAIDTAKSRTAAQIDLPNAIAQAKQASSLIDSLINHPGLEASVGAKGVTGGLLGGWVVPGSDAADFTARLQQIQGQNFLQAYQTLKGGGQITEVEGAKAQAAISRMNTSQSEKEFRQAAQELKNIINTGVQRAAQKAGVQSAQPVVGADPRIQQARDAGYSDEEIQQYLQGGM